MARSVMDFSYFTVLTKNVIYFTLCLIINVYKTDVIIGIIFSGRVFVLCLY